jgi:predicted RND superfamily exporter protein
MDPFIPLKADPQEWAEIEDFTTGFPLSRNVLVSEDARYAILIGVYERDLQGLEEKKAFRDDIRSALSETEAVVEAVHVLAFPFLEIEGVEAVRKDLKAYGLWAAGLILVILMVTFRSPLAVLLVLLWEVIGIGILIGMFTAMDQAVDLYTGILFPLVGGLQLTFVVHYLSALQRLSARVPPSEAAGRALREVFPPSALAALTTMAGLTALAVSDLPTLQAFGRIGVPSVALIFLVTFLIPLAVGLRRPPADAADSSAEPQRRFPRRWAVAVCVGFVVAVAALIPWLFQVRTDIRAVEFIQPGHPIRESIEVLNRDLGGTNIFQVRVDSGRPRGLQTLSMLRYLEDIRTFAAEMDGVTDAYAYSQLYMGLNQIWQGGDRTAATLPESTATLMLFSQLINSTPLLFEESFVDAQARSALMMLRSRDMPAQEYLELLERFMREAEILAPEGVTLEPVNGLHTLLEGDRQVVQAQLSTLGWSIGLVALILAVLWRSPKTALLVLTANLPALVAIFGGMGLTGFPLNSITVMVAAVILGIAVDDGIHLVGAFRQHRKAGMSPEQAAGVALREKVKPMACTSALLAVFLGLLLLTSFPPVAHFGILGAVGIATAFLGAVVLLPSLLVLFLGKSCQSIRVR